MAQNYTRQSSFSDGDTISASLFNDEYNQIVNAFSYSSSSASSTGHRHDGSSGQGGNIFKIGDLDFLNKIEVDSTNNRWGFYVEVSSAAVEQIRIQDGAIVPVTTNDIDLGTSSLQFKDLYIDGTANLDSLVLGSGSTVTTILDEDDLSSDSATALVTQQSVKAYVDAQVTAQDLDFQADTGGALSIDLDSESLTFTGGTGIDTSGSLNTVTFAIDSTVATLTGTQTLTNKTLTSPDVNTPDIDGGTIDGATIATSDITVGTGKTLDVSSGTLTLANDQISGDKVEGGTIASTTITSLASTTVDTTNVEVTNIKAKDGTSAGSIADTTGVVTLASSVLTTTDINGGTIDGATIGATTPAAVSATTVSATGNITVGGTVDGRDVATDGTKLDSIESGATADQTAAEIKTAYESNANTNAFTDADESKLDGIEALADVTDTANVSAAGALMDSELTSEASVKALNQGVATTDSPTFAGLTTAGLTLGATAITATGTELNYVDGVTSAIQTQLDSKAPTANPTFTGSFTSPGIDDNADAIAITIDSSENVGIGTNSPTDNLSVGTLGSGSNSIITIGASTTGTSSIYFGDGASAARFRGYFDYVHSSDHLAIGTAATERMRIDSSGQVGIGTSSPTEKLHIEGSGNVAAQITTTGGGVPQLKFVSPAGTESIYANVGSVRMMQFNVGGSERMRIDSSGTLILSGNGGSTTNSIDIAYNGTSGQGSFNVDSNGGNTFLTFGTSSSGSLSEAMRIDSSGNLLVGKTSSGLNAAGFEVASSGRTRLTRDSANVVEVNRTTNDGSLVTFSKDGTTVGSIGSSAGNSIFVGSGDVGVRFSDTNDAIYPMTTGGINRDAATDLGLSTVRFKDLYLSGDVNLANNSQITFASTSCNIEGNSSGADFIKFTTASSEAMRVDSSGNLLVGTTTITGVGGSSSPEGVVLDGNNAQITVGTSSDVCATFNRQTTDGSIVQFRKDGSTIGSISASTNLNIGSGGTRIWFRDGTKALRPVSTEIGNGSDGIINIGEVGGRFKDLYLSGGVYLGGTGSANKLDDYETGTFTPTVYSSDNTTVLTSGVDYALNDYRYVKTGNHVMMEVRIQDLRATKTDIWCTLPFTSLTSDSGVGITAEGDVIYLASNRLNFRKGTNQYPYGIVNFESS